MVNEIDDLWNEYHIAFIDIFLLQHQNYLEGSKGMGSKYKEIFCAQYKVCNLPTYNNHMPK